MDASEIYENVHEFGMIPAETQMQETVVRFREREMSNAIDLAQGVINLTTSFT